MWIEKASSYYSPKPAYVCVDPQTYGHRNRYGTGGENKLPEEAKAERREVIENNKAWRAAEPVRRDYIRTLLNAGKVPRAPCGSSPPRSWPTPPRSAADPTN